MWLIEASKPPVDGPVGMNLQRTPLDSGEMSQITVTRRRIKVRRLKYTCRTKKTSSSSEEEDVGDSVKVSLSVSSSEKDEVVLSYGSVSVIWRRREMEDAVRAELGIMNKKGGGVGVGGKYDFFGVYDGHGGCHVARACSERLHGILVEEGESSNEELEGLSEAVLFSGGVALALSRDHKYEKDKKLTHTRISTPFGNKADKNMFLQETKPTKPNFLPHSTEFPGLIQPRIPSTILPPTIPLHNLPHHAQPCHQNFSLDFVAYTKLVQFSTKSGSLIYGKAAHGHMIKTAFRSCLFLLNNLLHMYCKCGEINSAHHMFDRMPKHNVISYNSLLSGYSQMGLFVKAMEVFNEARVVGLKLDKFTFAGALNLMDLSLYYLFIERRSLELLYVYHSRIAYYYLYSLLNIVLLYVTTKVVLGTPWVVALLIYKWRRRHFINK
nr:pentatricopeptide repeat-containing protein [Quercus suber]